MAPEEAPPALSDVGTSSEEAEDEASDPEDGKAAAPEQFRDGDGVIEDMVNLESSLGNLP